MSGLFFTLAHFVYFARALNATAIAIGGTLLTDDALRHERTPYSILVAFATTTDTEPKLDGGSCFKNRNPPAHNRGSVLWPYSVL